MTDADAAGREAGQERREQERREQERRERDRTEAVRSLEAEFAALITQVRRIVSENAERVSPGMLPAAYKVFTTIVRFERVTQSALAEALVADKGQISRTVKELEDLGLVGREPDPTDRRSSILFPTAYGLERLAVARAPQESSLLDALQEWSVDDIRTLTRLLHALTAREQP